jgi:signal recognition particle receptor subunit beta
MVVLNYTGGEVNAKIVYYGPGLSGKTTNLEFIHDRTPEGSRGKMVSMKTQTDRTLFFDFLPLELGEINGYRTRFLLYTVPGQVYYNATRKLVLKGADAVVFVADSSRSKLDENLESLRNLEQNLNEHGMSLDEIPWVIQYNKRDASDAMAASDLDARLNPLKVPSFEAVATQGTGVYETFHGIATLVYSVLKERLESELAAVPNPARPVPAAAQPAARAQAQPAAPAAGGDFDFDMDSMLREMDAPGTHSAPRAAAAPAAPVTPASPVQRTVYTPPTAAPAAPVAVAPAAAASRPAPVPAPVTPAHAGPAVTPRAPEAPAFHHAPDAFDLELGRLPALDDASTASDNARDEGPNEFVTDPMRRATAVATPPAPRIDRTPRVEPVAPAQTPEAVESTAVIEHVEHIEPVPAPLSHEPTVISVPVVLSRAQARPGSSIRVVLDIRIGDD